MGTACAKAKNHESRAWKTVVWLEYHESMGDKVVGAINKRHPAPLIGTPSCYVCWVLYGGSAWCYSFSGWKEKHIGTLNVFFYYGIVVTCACISKRCVFLIIAYVFSSTNVETRAKPVLPGSEGVGGQVGEMAQKMYAHMNK
jgi:hypothetical protein